MSMLASTGREGEERLLAGPQNASPGPTACGTEGFRCLEFVRNHYLEYRKKSCDPSCCNQVLCPQLGGTPE